MVRARWDSRLVFIMAAVGSAVGLGNVWRFPYMVGENGGAAFLIPYFLMLAVIGIPLLIIEFYIGQRFQHAAVEGFAKINKAFRWVGVFALLCGATVIAYYAAVMAWSWKYLFASWSLPWAGQSSDYFFGSVLQLSDSISVIGGFVWPLVGFLLLTWIAIYFSIFKGVKSVGKVILVTMPLPILLLIILVVRAITLPGMQDGLAFFLSPNWSILLDWQVWSAAASQIFFTLTLGFGVMIAYSSFNEKKQDFVGDAITTAILNSSISIVSGFAVFGTLGYMAAQQATSVAEIAAGGPGLAFVVFPEALTLLPALAPLFAVLFFIMLLTLGIDSAFSLVEAITAGLKDKFSGIKIEHISLLTCGIMFVAGLPFVTKAGLYYLDIIDHYILNYGIALVGLLTSIAIGWVHGPEKVLAFAKTTKGLQLNALWSVAVKYVVPVLMVILIGITAYNDITTPYSGYPVLFQFLALGYVGALLIVSVIVAKLYDAKVANTK